jgi:hypothetical protein
MPAAPIYLLAAMAGCLPTIGTGQGVATSGVG